LSLCHKLKFSNPYVYGTWWCRLLIFQTKIIWCNIIQSLKYLRSSTLGCRDIGIRKSEFVLKTQLLSFKNIECIQILTGIGINIECIQIFIGIGINIRVHTNIYSRTYLIKLIYSRPYFIKLLFSYLLNQINLFSSLLHQISILVPTSSNYSIFVPTSSN